MAKRIQVADPKLQRRISRAMKTSTVAKVSTRERSDETPSVEIEYTFVANSLADLHAIARYFDFEVQGRGRFPWRRLRDEIMRPNGYDLVVDYDPRVTTIDAAYYVSLMQIEGDRVFPRSGIVSGEQIRNALGVRTGQPAKSDLADLAVEIHGWGEEYLTDSLTVEKITT